MKKFFNGFIVSTCSEINNSCIYNTNEYSRYILYFHCCCDNGRWQRISVKYSTPILMKIFRFVDQPKVYETYTFLTVETQIQGLKLFSKVSSHDHYLENHWWRGRVLKQILLSPLTRSNLIYAIKIELIKKYKFIFIDTFMETRYQGILTRHSQ